MLNTIMAILVISAFIAIFVVVVLFLIACASSLIYLATFSATRGVKDGWSDPPPPAPPAPVNDEIVSELMAAAAQSKRRSQGVVERLPNRRDPRSAWGRS